MIVKCIDNISRVSGFVLSITPGKNYDVIDRGYVPYSSSRPFDYSGAFYKIMDNCGKVVHFSEDNFRPLNISELRELKLNELGIYN
jgi:hypothetical protein